MRAIAFTPPIAAPGAPPAATRLRLALRAAGDGSLAAPIPAVLRGRWCLITVRPFDASSVCTIRIAGAQQDPTGTEVGLSSAGWKRASRHAAIAYIQAEAASIRLLRFGHGAPPGEVVLTCRPVSYAAAALTACLQHPLGAARAVVRAARAGPRQAPSRLRRDLGGLALLSHTPARYELWADLFDRWTAADLASLLGSPSRAQWPDIEVFIFRAARAANAPFAATLESVDDSPLQPRHRVITSAAAFAEALTATTADYVAVLQSGEVLPPPALPLLAEAAETLGRPDILYADEDALTPNGRRRNPVFKPAASRTLMLSGTLASGVWLIRRGLLERPSPGAEAWAETLRLDAWLRLHESGRGGTCHRIPRILTHRRADAEAAPADKLAEVVRRHLSRTNHPARIEPDRPLRVRVAAPRDQQPLVSLIVPSACRLPHVARCLRAVLARTDYAAFELIVVVAGPLPLDRRQQAVLARLGADRRVRPLLLQAERFNYAAANNAAVRQAEGALICLLNDDITPLAPGWLAAMVGHLADPRVGIVGARLLYLDRSVQHAGVILRPDGTAEHAHRFLSCNAPGYAGRAALSQEFSAVTGACLLTRRDLYEELGGLDESFASAFGDIDFCLRARAAGLGVVLAAEAELIHHESRTFGRHYTLGDEARAAADRARMSARWASVCAQDPFHNPNLGREPGRLWLPAFPPRIGPLRSTDLDPSSRDCGR